MKIYSSFLGTRTEVIDAADISRSIKTDEKSLNRKFMKDIERYGRSIKRYVHVLFDRNGSHYNKSPSANDRSSIMEDVSHDANMRSVRECDETVVFQ